MSERMRDTTVIQERILAQKDLPAMTASRVADTQSTAQSGYYQKQGVSQFVKFAENTACKYQVSVSSLLMTTCIVNCSRPQRYCKLMEQAGDA